MLEFIFFILCLIICLWRMMASHCRGKTHYYFFASFPSSRVVLWDCFKFHSITIPPAHIFRRTINEPPTGNPLKTSSWALAERTDWCSCQKPFIVVSRWLAYSMWFPLSLDTHMGDAGLSPAMCQFWKSTCDTLFKWIYYYYLFFSHPKCDLLIAMLVKLQYYLNFGCPVESL